MRRRRWFASMVKPARRFLVGGLCFLAFLALACVGEFDRTPPESSTITILYGGDEWVLGPQADDYPQRLVFLALVRLDENGDPQPRLAESWDHSPDYRTWTIRLRRDVRWHDGVPVTARDVLFSMELWTHPDVLYWTAGPIESSSLPDDYTLTVTFAKPTQRPLDGWSSIYPKHLLEQLDPSRYYVWEFWTQPVGNGSYRYVRHIPKTMIELEANPDYYRGKPRIERVLLKGTGGANALVELLSGNVDAIRGVGEADVLKVAEDPRFRIYRQVNAGWSRGLMWNHRHPLFRDARVRLALTLAIDRREVHRVLNLPEETPLFDGIYTRRQYRRGDLGAAWPYDRERAKQLLVEAGWVDRDVDGVREREDIEASFELLVGVAMRGTFRTYERAAISLQEQLDEVGIRVNLHTLDAGLVGERLRTGEFEASLSIFPHNPRDILRRGLFSEESPNSYVSPELVRLLEAADSKVGPEATDSLYREMREIFRQELPFLFLYPHGWSSVVHRRVRGLHPPHRVNLFSHMEELWLEEEP